MSPEARARLGLAAGVLPAWLAVSIVPQRDPDSFWHLATGALALARRSTLPVDPFSFSHPGAPWRHKDLVADVVLAMAARAGGPLGLVAVKYLAVLAVAFGFYLAPARDRRSVATALALTAATLSSVLLLERSSLFSIALFPLFFAALAHARRQWNADETRALVHAFAPAVALVWAWTCLHRFALLGHGALVGVAMMAALARALRARPLARSVLGMPSARGVQIAVAAAVIAPLVSLANPSGLGAFTTPFAVAASESFRQRFTDWQRLAPGALVAAFPIVALLVVLALVLTIASLVTTARRAAPGDVDLFDLGLVLLFVLLVRDSVRWVPYVTLASALAASRALAAFVPKLTAIAPGRTLALLAGLVSLLSAAGLAFARDRVPYQLGEDRHWAPASAVAFARDNGLAGDVVNAFEFGGYVIAHMSPGTRVLVDGRNDQVYPPAFVLDCLDAENDAALFAKMRETDHATWVIGKNQGREISFAFLARDPAWAVVHWSDTALVFVRRDAHADVARVAFRYVNPTDPEASIQAATRALKGNARELAGVLAEVSRFEQASPGAVRGQIYLALFHQGVGAIAERDAALEKAIELGEGREAVREAARRVREAK